MTKQFVMSVWNDVCQKYWPHRWRADTDLKKFTELTMFLEKEQVDPEKYFEFCFGVKEIGPRPPKPVTLADPERIALFRYMT